MSGTRSLTRRAALAGIGAGSLSLAWASARAESPPVENRETGGSTGTVAVARESDILTMNSENTLAANNIAMADHPLTGLWLSTVKLGSHPENTVVVPSVFSADGLVMLMFPVSTRGDAGVQLQGAAIGTWEMLDFQSAHFTVVQLLSDTEGNFTGSVTIDGYPRVLPGGVTFEDNSELSVMLLRDSLNRVFHAIHGAGASSMVGSRMSPGHTGFVDTDYDPVNLSAPR